MAGFLPEPLLVLSILSGLLSFTFFVSSLVAFRKRKLFGMGLGITFTLLMLCITAIFALLSVGLQGYRSLTHEEVAAVVTTTPTGEQRFRAEFEFPDGRVEKFDVLGDQLYVDAHILKWKSFANLLGLHTEYELDRVAGRYQRLDDEQNAARTVYSLARDSAVDLFQLRQRFARLSAFVDAEYGSASFHNAQEVRVLELRVSTSGLLFRPKDS